MRCKTAQIRNADVVSTGMRLDAARDRRQRDQLGVRVPLGHSSSC